MESMLSFIRGLVGGASNGKVYVASSAIIRDGDEAELWSVIKRKPQVSEELAEEVFALSLRLETTHKPPSADEALAVAGMDEEEEDTGGSAVWYGSKPLPLRNGGGTLSELLLATTSTAPLDSKHLGLLASLATLLTSYFPQISTTSSLSQLDQLHTHQQHALSLDSSLAVLSLALSALRLNLPAPPSPQLLPVIELLLTSLQSLGLAVPYDASVDTRRHYASSVRRAIALLSSVAERASPGLCSVHDLSILLQNLSPSLTLVSHQSSADTLSPVSRGHWRLCLSTLELLSMAKPSSQAQAAATYSRIRSAMALSAPLPRDLAAEIACAAPSNPVPTRALRFLLLGLKYLVAAGLVGPTSYSSSSSTSLSRRSLVLSNRSEWLGVLRQSVALLLGGQGAGFGVGVSVAVCPLLLEVLLHFFLHWQPALSGSEADAAETDQALTSTAGTMITLLTCYTALLRQKRGVKVPTRPPSSNPSSLLERFNVTHGSGLVRAGSGRNSSRSVVSTDSAPETYSSVGSLGAAFGTDGGLSESAEWVPFRSPMGLHVTRSSAPPNFFAVGDKVDGLCALQNGSKRWFPAVCTACNPEAGTYSLQYLDGDSVTDVPASDVRPTKNRTLLGSSTSSTPLPFSSPMLKQSPSPRLTPASFSSNLYVSPPSAARPTPMENVANHNNTNSSANNLVSLTNTNTNTNDGDSDNDSDDNVFEIPSVFDQVEVSTSSSAALGAHGLGREGSGSHSSLVGRLHLQDLPLDHSSSGVFGAGSLSGGIVQMEPLGDNPLALPALTLHSSRLHSASSMSRPPTGFYSGRHTARPGQSRGTEREVLMSASEQKPVRGTTPGSSSSDATTRMLSFRGGDRSAQSTARLHGGGGALLSGRNSGTGTGFGGSAVATSALTSPATLHAYTLVAAVCVSACCTAMRQPQSSVAASRLRPVATAAQQALEEFLAEAALLDLQGNNLTNALYLLASTTDGPTGRRLVTLLGAPPLPSVPNLELLGLAGVRVGHGAFGSVIRVEVPFSSSSSSSSLTPATKAYAVKCMQRHKSHGLVGAFDVAFNEIAVWERLRQCRVSGVVELVSYGVVRDEYWMVMPLCGSSLASWRAGVNPALATLHRDAKSAVASKYWLAILLELLCECFRVVDAVHAAGVIHFDIKADNFLLAPALEGRLDECGAAAASSGHTAASRLIDSLCSTLSALREQRQRRRQNVEGRSAEEPPQLLLTDFGESLLIPTSSSLQQRQISVASCKGTLPIQAPEMLSLNGSGIGASESAGSAALGPGKASDVWSLGCLGVELLSGRHLFADLNWTEMFVMLCTAPSPSVSAPASAKGEAVPLAGTAATTAPHHALLRTALSGPFLAGLDAELVGVLRVLTRAQSLDPAVRPEAAELAQELEALLDEISGGSGEEEGESSSHEADYSPHRPSNSSAAADGTDSTIDDGGAGEQVATSGALSSDCVALLPGALLDWSVSEAELTVSSAPGPGKVMLLPPSSWLGLSPLLELPPSMGSPQPDAAFLCSGLSRASISLGSRAVVGWTRPAPAPLKPPLPCFVLVAPVERSASESSTAAAAAAAMQVGVQAQAQALAGLASSDVLHALPVPVLVDETEGGGAGAAETREIEALQALTQALGLLLENLRRLRANDPSLTLTLLLAPLDREPPASVDGSLYSLLSLYTAILLQLWWQGERVSVESLRAVPWVGLLPPSGIEQILSLSRSFKGVL